MEMLFVIAGRNIPFVIRLIQCPRKNGNYLTITIFKCRNLIYSVGNCRRKEKKNKINEKNVDNFILIKILLLLERLKYKLSTELSTLSTIFNKHYSTRKM